MDRRLQSQALDATNNACDLADHHRLLPLDSFCLSSVERWQTDDNPLPALAPWPAPLLTKQSGLCPNSAFAPTRWCTDTVHTTPQCWILSRQRRLDAYRNSPHMALAEGPWQPRKRLCLGLCFKQEQSPSQAEICVRNKHDTPGKRASRPGTCPYFPVFEASPVSGRLSSAGGHCSAKSVCGMGRSARRPHQSSRRIGRSRAKIKMTMRKERPRTKSCVYIP